MIPGLLLLLQLLLLLDLLLPMLLQELLVNSRVTTYVWGCSTASMVACLMVACMVFICVIAEGERGGGGGFRHASHATPRRHALCSHPTRIRAPEKAIVRLRLLILSPL